MNNSDDHQGKATSGGLTAAAPLRNIFRKLGPGLITGASDDDPSGIATYSQVGAQFGYGMLWTMLFSYPLMAAIQEISARIGRVSGCGIAGNMRRHYSVALTYPLVTAMVIANTINMGADIAAMGAAVKLVIGGPSLLYGLLFVAGSLILQIFVPYSSYVKYLKWLTLVLFSYVATTFITHVSWVQALHSTVQPAISFHVDYLKAFVAVLGTTISPYLFFWQASQEVEEIDNHFEQKPLNDSPRQAPRQIRRIKMDTYLGMALSNLVAFFIILATAATLHSHGKTHIDTATQAAEALRPIAGKFAFALFSLGIIGTGLLSLPVLGGSAAYAVGEIMRWPVGLERGPLDAKAFYGVLAGATILGALIELTPIDPIQALFWSAIINGMVAGPVMIMLMLMATNRAVMGRFVISMRLRVLGWLSSLVMIAAAVGLFITLGR